MCCGNFKTVPFSLHVLFPLPRRAQLIVILKRATGIIGFLLLHVFISELLPDVGHMLQMVSLSPEEKKKTHPNQTPQLSPSPCIHGAPGVKPGRFFSFDTPTP